MFCISTSLLVHTELSHVQNSNIHIRYSRAYMFPYCYRVSRTLSAWLESLRARSRALSAVLALSRSQFVSSPSFFCLGLWSIVVVIMPQANENDWAASSVYIALSTVYCATDIARCYRWLFRRLLSVFAVTTGLPLQKQERTRHFKNFICILYNI